MAQGNQRTSIWSRGVITLLIVVWGAIALGNWLAHHEEVQEKLGKGEKEGTAQEANIPEAKLKPWKGDISKMQQELDEENSGALRGENQEAEVVVATPVAAAEQPAEAAEGTQAQADTAASADAGSAEPASYILRFASFHQEDYAVEMLTRLSTNNVKGKIHKVSDADGTDVYQVISADEYSSLEAANAAKSDMLKIGVDAVVASSKD